jgi:hypothetical protein
MSHLYRPTSCYGDSFSFLYSYVDNVHTLLETHLRASMKCYGDRLSYFYIDDVRTSQVTHIWASMECYGDSLSYFYVDDVRTSQVTHIWASMECYGDSLLFYTLQSTMVFLLYIPPNERMSVTDKLQLVWKKGLAVYFMSPH